MLNSYGEGCTTHKGVILNIVSFLYIGFDIFRSLRNPLKSYKNRSNKKKVIDENTVENPHTNIVG